ARSPPLTDPHHHFAERGARLHGLEGVAKFRERKDLTDDWREFLLLQPCEELRGDALLRFRLAPGDLGNVYAGEHAALQERQVEGQGRDLPGGKADNEVTSVPGDGSERLHRDLAADGIIDHVRTVVGGQLLQYVAPV